MRMGEYFYFFLFVDAMRNDLEMRWKTNATVLRSSKFKVHAHFRAFSSNFSRLACDLILNTIHFKITGILQILTNSAIFFDEILQTLLALVDSDEIALDVSENGAKHCKHSEKPTKKLD